MPAEVKGTQLQGNIPVLPKKKMLRSKGEAVSALKSWGSLGIVKPLASVQALKPFVSGLQGLFSWAATLEAAVPPLGPRPDLCSVFFWVLLIWMSLPSMSLMHRRQCCFPRAAVAICLSSHLVPL